jgi:hypothetical protein
VAADVPVICSRGRRVPRARCAARRARAAHRKSQSPTPYRFRRYSSNDRYFAACTPLAPRSSSSCPPMTNDRGRTTCTASPVSAPASSLSRSCAPIERTAMSTVCCA